MADDTPPLSSLLAQPSIPLSSMMAIAKQGQTLPPQYTPYKPTADSLINAAGPLGDAGMQLGDMMRTGNFDASSVPQILGGAMMGVAAPKGEGAAEAAAEEAVPLASKVIQGIKAYHGSPSDFDQFDFSKLLTGEGANSYGSGGYFAENPAVAAEYKGKLSMLANVNNNPEAQTALYYLQQNGFDKGAARADLESRLNQKLADTHPQVQAINSYDPGKMYEVNINADPSHFLDWDKPLSEQSPQVQAALKNVGVDTSDPGLEQRVAAASGLRLYPPKNGTVVYPQDLPDIKSPSAAQTLNQLGIPGIKYLDQGSRGRPASMLDPQITAYQNRLSTDQTLSPSERDQIQGSLDDLQKEKAAVAKGTSNYVVFNDKLIDILKKYGLAGMLGGGGAGAAMQQQQPQVPLASMQAQQ